MSGPLSRELGHAARGVVHGVHELHERVARVAEDLPTEVGVVAVEAHDERLVRGVPELLERTHDAVGDRVTRGDATEDVDEHALHLAVAEDDVGQVKARGVHAQTDTVCERLDVFVKREWAGEPHEGETPRSVVADTLRFSSNAVALISSIPQRDIARNRAEFERLQNDFRCIELMAQNYAEKVRAAERVLRYNFSKDIADMEAAERHMARSLDYFRELTQLTAATYSFANSMQTGHRKIPFGGAINGVGTNYHWTHVLPLYEKELEDFRARVAEMKDPTRATTQAPRAPWPAAKFTLLSTNAETYEVREGARPFMDRQYKLFNLAPELRGLTGIRFSHEKAKNGRYVPIEFEVREPVRVLIGYFQNEREIWLQVPNLDVASHADERGGVEPVLRNAASVEECPDVNVHAFRYEPGRHRLELIGKGSFIVLGVVPQSVELEKRDARLGAR